MTKIENGAEILTKFIDGVNAKELADEYGVHITTIYRSLHKFGVQPSKLGEDKEFRNELIVGEYEDGCPVKEIASRFRIKPSTVYAVIKNSKRICI